MKYTLLILAFFTIFGTVASQDTQKASTKMDDFVSKTGVIVRFEDHNLEDIKLAYGTAEARIRVMTAGGETEYFLQITNEGKYNSNTASIAYEDVLEVNKAFESLQAAAQAEERGSTTYVENKFITDDGFQIGYYFSDGKLVWFMKLERYASDATVFLKDVTEVVNAFNNAISRMEALRAK